MNAIAVALLLHGILGQGVRDARANSAASPTANRHRPDIGDVRFAVEARRSAIHSMALTCRVTNLAKPDRYSELVVAAKGECRFASQRHFADGRLLRDSRDFDRFYRPQHFDVYFPFDRCFETTSRGAVRPFTDKSRRHAVFEALGWWPVDDTSAPPGLDDEPWFLHEVLSRVDALVAPSQQNVNGRLCNMVQVAAVDVLWLDADRATLVRRERFNGEPPKLRMRYEFDDFREIATGIWMPFRILRTVPSERLVARFDVHEITINDVADDRFLFEPTPGTLIRDRDTDTITGIPGDIELLEETNERVQRYAKIGNSHRRAGITISNRGRVALAALGCALGFAIGKSISFFTSRMLRRRRGAPVMR